MGRIYPSADKYALVQYDAMCRAIDACYQVDEVKIVRDKALAIELYAMQAKNIEAERRACEIRLRAERKAGELLKSMPKSKGGRPENSEQPAPSSFAKTKEEAGISDDQAKRWQKLADIPQEEFEAALRGEGKPSTNGILNPNPGPPPVNSSSLWVWGRLKDFERDGILNLDASELLANMTLEMQRDAVRLAPLVSQWLRGIEAKK